MATLNIRLPEQEIEVLEAYCKKAGRTKTDVIREFIRALGDAK
jgi:predicted DNA-binding protein